MNYVYNPVKFRREKFLVTSVAVNRPRCNKRIALGSPHTELCNTDLYLLLEEVHISVSNKTSLPFEFDS